MRTRNLVPPDGGLPHAAEPRRPGAGGFAGIWLVLGASGLVAAAATTARLVLGLK